jgi:putative oxidoreductase
MLLSHGMPYLRSFEESAPGFNDPFGLGGAMTLVLVIAVEVGASLLLVLGYKSRLAALALAVTMTVAFVHVHGAEFSGEQSGELAFLYLLGFITLSITGPGRLSVDGC